MKKLLVSIILSFSIKAFSCSCAYMATEINYVQFETVFLARVTNLAQFSENSTLPTEITVEVLEIYKGNPTKKIKIKYDNKCPTPHPDLNSEWVFFLSKNKNGLFEITPCNPSRSIEPRSYLKNDPERLQTFTLETKNSLTLLRFMKEKLNGTLKWEWIFPVDYQYGIYEHLEKFMDKNVQNEFGFYLIVFNESKEIKSIEVLQSLGQDTDSKVIQFYKGKRGWNYREDKHNEKEFFEKNTATPIVVWKNNLL